MRIPIRYKIAVLITASIGISLISVLWIATSLIHDDKISYIYDLSTAQSRSVADSLENKIQRLHDSGRVLARLAGDPALEGLYHQQEGEAALGALLLLRPSPDLARFSVESSLGSRAKDAESMVSTLGWTPATIDKQGVLTGASIQGWIPLAGKAVDRTGTPVAYFILAHPEAQLPEKSNTVEIRVLDSEGEKIDREESHLPPKALKRLGKELAQASFNSGVREWEDSEKKYIVSYQRIASGKLMVASITPRDQAFEAARTLENRALGLGLSVFLIALGATIGFSRTLTEKLRKMWNVTQKIAQGDFTTRVEVKGRVGDEVNDLASSFNVMADKVVELMAKTAEKARLENELKTAQVVQSYLFPSAGLSGKNFRIAGRFLPATECGGDWWSCVELKGKLIAVVGDVTGHGASAALITAVAHGAFHAYLQELKSHSDAPELSTLVSRLNEAVCSASHHGASMTFLAISLDPSTGELEFCNVGHCHPYIHRRSNAPDASNALKRFVSLTSRPTPALGIDFGTVAPVNRAQLEPGDVVVLYTDGLIECENAQGEQFGRTPMLRMIDEILPSGFTDYDSIPHKIMEGFLGFLGAASEKRDDDTTVVVLTIPSDACFGEMPTKELPTPPQAPGQTPAEAA